MITNRFNYKPLSRETINNKRLYLTPDGKQLASVTTILDLTKSAEKRLALENWRKSVGAQQAAEITAKASGRGTRMHKFLEQYVKTGTLPEPGSNPYSQESHLMARTVINKGLSKVNEFWGMEVGLYYPELYAGTTDGCGVHNNEQVIFDFKQVNKPKKIEYIEDYFLQLTLYMMAHNKLYDTNIRKGVILMCVKPPEIALGRWGTPIYQEFILESKDFNYWEDKAWNRVEEFYLKN